MFYQLSPEEVIRQLATHPEKGLSHKEVKKRQRHGANILPAKEKPPLIFKFFDQFRNILVLILLLASVVSLFLGDALDAIAIGAIVILNATIGFIQEVQAEKTLEGLKQKDLLFALVVRESAIEKIPFAELVPGDIILLEEGEKVPADCRVIESFSLRVDESILTGESLASSKNAKIIIPAVPLGDRLNMVYRDTQVLAGRAKAIVTQTGEYTEIGKIATALETTTSEKTPLTVELEKVAQMLTIIIGVIASIVFLLNLREKTPFVESLLVSISLSVAAIPEGLPAIVTIVLSLGVKRLAEKRTIVKKLPAVETLGAIKIIATDKTGTITQNKINVVRIILPDFSTLTVEGIGFHPTGTFFDSGKKIINPGELTHLERLLRAGILANNASFEKKGSTITPLGDTTEVALLVAGARANFDSEEVKKAEPKVFEVPFTSERKMMSVIVQVDETRDHILYAKGAPEVMVEKCILSPAQKKHILEGTKRLAQNGLRSLLLARKKLNIPEVKNALENDVIAEDKLEFLGLVGMQDPLRPEVKEAIAKAREAGIRTIMITGDHKETAAAIAQEAGIRGENRTVLTEDEVATLTKKELAQKIKEGINVFARISPLGKLKIIEAIKSIPHTLVAVTGDGVNDAPALKSGHIGIAMGQTGTDITREVADMVITDDNYATIIDAIREGRTVFANLVKFIRYLISCNLSEVIVVAGGFLFGAPVVLLPIQILWINLVTDGFPALALGVDPPEYDVMRRPPRDLSIGILHAKRWMYMTIEGSIMGITTLFLFFFASSRFDYVNAQTMAFATLAFSQLIHAFNNRSTRKSLFQIGPFGNKPLIAAALLSITLQILATQTSLGNHIFKTIALDADKWLFVVLASLIPFAAVELKKQLRFRILP